MKETLLYMMLMVSLIHNSSQLSIDELPPKTDIVEALDLDMYMDE